MLAIKTKQHLDLKTLKLCHLEKVKQFSKHFHLIFFSNWNSSKPTFSHKIVLSQTIGIFWGTMLLGGSPCQPKGLLLAFCHQLPPSAGSPCCPVRPWQHSLAPAQEIKSIKVCHQAWICTSTGISTYLPVSMVYLHFVSLFHLPKCSHQAEE